MAAASEDEQFMREALLEAANPAPTPNAFCVGCLIVAYGATSQPFVLARGFSRELPGNTHAEANALSKVSLLLPNDIATLTSISPPPSAESLLASSTVYTTLEPCSVRTSGLAPCADALIRAKVKRCVIGVGEPDDFVQCEGAKKLKEAGVDVVWLKGMESECLSAARRGH